MATFLQRKGCPLHFIVMRKRRRLFWINYKTQAPLLTLGWGCSSLVQKHNLFPLPSSACQTEQSCAHYDYPNYYFTCQMVQEISDSYKPDSYVSRYTVNLFIVINNGELISYFQKARAEVINLNNTTLKQTPRFIPRVIKMKKIICLGYFALYRLKLELNIVEGQCCYLNG